MWKRSITAKPEDGLAGHSGRESSDSAMVVSTVS
jgi:hypothetical protein